MVGIVGNVKNNVDSDKSATLFLKCSQYVLTLSNGSYDRFNGSQCTMIHGTFGIIQTAYMDDIEACCYYATCQA